MAIFKPADILIPQNVDFTKWSVVACDQYTSEREYWEDVKNIVGDSPSTLNIIFPEVYLEDGDGDERIKKINSTMEEYINKGIFRELKDTFIYVKRTQPNGKTRHGIVGMLDLEEYDFSKGSQSKVRATEALHKNFYFVLLYFPDCQHSEPQYPLRNLAFHRFLKCRPPQ